MAEFERPSIPYLAQSLPNNDRYTLLTAQNKSVSADILEGETNYCIDSLNKLNDSINSVAIGILPGANLLENAGLFPTTNGQNPATLSWTKVGANQLFPNSVTLEKFGLVTNGSILGANAEGKVIPITGALNQVLTSQNNQVAKFASLGSLIPGANTLANGVIVTDGAGALSTSLIKAANIDLKAVKAKNIDSETALIGTVMTAGVGGAASFLPLPGRILQIKSTVLKSPSFQNNATATYQPFPTPLAVSITNLGANSTILVFVSATFTPYTLGSAGAGYPQKVGSALFKNNAIWSAATGVTAGSGGNYLLGGVSFSVSTSGDDMKTVTALCSETVAAPGTVNTYSFQAYNRDSDAIVLNGTAPYSENPNQIELVSISSIFAIEIGS